LKTAVIFGGTGFIGVFLAQHLVDEALFDSVVLFDLEEVSEKGYGFRRALLCRYPQIIFRIGDVRQSIEWVPEGPISLVINLAAVHREPGHEPEEYYETNLKGAENVCAWSNEIGCKNIVFSSSIAPYGPSETPKNESSLPCPETAYGGSKLAAEKIHQIWQKNCDDDRRLVIVRPGVVFGPTEGGNVSRLIRAVRKRYFFYTGNRNTRKAGVYVKELCYAICWAVEAGDDKYSDGVLLFNMSMSPGPSIQEYVDAIGRVSNMTPIIPRVPFLLLLAVARVIDVFAKPFNISHPFSHVRLKKLVRSNNIEPKFLVENGYKYRYTLDEAFMEWKEVCPEEWS
jgi:nucleoside-diphosphate-sugar epimerase